MIAIMGSSGAGKSTLLNCLSGRLSTGSVSGSILYNGQQRTSRTWRRTTAFVEQDDALFAHLTVQETLRYAAALRLPSSQYSKDEKNQRADDILKVLRLSKASSTRIGDGETRGVSGGERKRTAIGQELIGDPEILFLDEPTSGLDSNSSFAILENVRADAEDRGRIVIATLHQPSFDLLNLFHKIILLSGGNTIFMGSPAEAVQHFERLGFKARPQQNPADMFLDLITINHSGTSEDALRDRARIQSLRQAYRAYTGLVAPDDIVIPGRPDSPLKEDDRSIIHLTHPTAPKRHSSAHHFRSPDFAAEVDPKLVEDLKKDLEPPTEIIVETEPGTARANVGPANNRPVQFPNAWTDEFLTLLSRNWRDVTGDRMTLRAQLARALILVLLFGFTFFRLANDQRGIMNRASILFFWPINMIFTTIVPVVSVFPKSRVIMTRERATRTYRTSSFLLSKFVSECVPVLFFAALASLPLYFLMGLRSDSLPGRLGIWMLVHLLCSLVALAVGFLIGANVSSDKVGKVIAPVVVIIFLLFGGGMINNQDIPVAFRVFQYISPVEWAMRANMRNEFDGVESIGCPSEVGAPCYSTGAQVLKLYSVDDMSTSVAVGALVGLTVGFLSLAYLSLRLRGPKMKLTSPPAVVTRNDYEADFGRVHGKPAAVCPLNTPRPWEYRSPRPVPGTPRPPLMSVARYAGTYVRRVCGDAALRARVAACLSTGKAFEEKDRMAVVMIDMSGYSKMAADLTFLGKMASEVITKSVGSYLNKIIDVISLFNGEIIKFLGDAVLVVFAPATYADDLGRVVLRALACCLAIASRYSVMDLDMTLADTAALQTGELGITLEAAELLDLILKAPLRSYSSKDADAAAHLLFGEHDVASLASVVLGFTSESTTEADLAIQFQRKWEGDASPAAPAAPADEDIELLRRFVNQSLLCKLEAQRNPRKRRPGPVVARKESSAARTVTQSTVLQAEEEKAALEKTETVNEGSFRSVTAIFVSLLFPFDAAKVQGVLVCFLAALKKFGGVFQQYSVFTGNLRNMFTHQQSVDVAISVATGDLLFTTIGNASRGEAGLLGEVVIIAARLMATAKDSHVLIMDEATHEHVKLTNATIVSMGLVKVKGRAEALRVFGIPLDGATDDVRKATTMIFGYEKEREVIRDRFAGWKAVGNEKHVIFVEAASGLGKSSLANFLIDLAMRENVSICLTQATEMEQTVPFRGLQNLLLYILEKDPSLTEGPRASLVPKRSHRVSCSRSLRSSVASREQDNDIFVQKVYTMLKNAGVEIKLAPLLTTVLPSVAIGETDLTQKMDTLARNNLLKSILLKIVVAYVMKSTVVLIFDDVQWLDSSSSEILSLVCRPIKDSVSKAMNSVVGLPQADHFVLGGLTESEAFQMITNGSPLFLQMITEVVIAKIGTELFINSEYQLATTNPSVEAESVLSDLGTAILFQFDRLDPILQSILKAASVLGQYFLLADALELADLDLSEDDALRFIKDHDMYNFILFPPAGDAGKTVEVAKVDHNLSFRHIGILNAIYESLSFEERISLNKLIAEMLEAVMDGENRAALMPTIEFHYSRTMEKEKIIDYRERIGCALVKKYQLVEGVRLLESLMQFTSELQAGSPSVEIVAPLRRAKWMSHLCFSYCILNILPKERLVALKALEILYGHLPKSDAEYVKATRLLQRGALKLWVQTSGGKRPRVRLIRDANDSQEITEYTKYELKRMVFEMLTDCFSKDRTWREPEMRYILFLWLNLLLRHNSDETTLCFCLLKIYGYTQIFHMHSLQGPMRRAIAARADVNNPTYAFALAVSYIYDAKFVHCRPLLDKYADYCKARCDMVGYVTANLAASSIVYLMGDLDYVQQKAYPIYVENQVVKDNVLVDLVISGLMLRSALLRGDVPAMTTWWNVYESRETMLRALKFAVGLRGFYTMWWLCMHSDFTGALAALEGSAADINVKEVGTQMVDLLGCSPFAIVLLMDPTRSGISLTRAEEAGGEFTAWSQTDLVRLQRVVFEYHSHSNYLKGSIYVFWAMHALAAFLKILHGHANDGVRHLRRMLRSGRRRELDGIKLMKALYYGLVAKY
ncbi:ATP-binding cassette sub- G member 2, partial [Irineochytrium annulatum]